jgi:hypothetical protein
MANMARILLLKVLSTLSSCQISACTKAAKNSTYVDVGDVLLHDLLGGVVDQNIQSTMLSDMVSDKLLAVLGVHDVEGEGNAFLSVLLDSLLDSLGADCQLVP